MFGNKSPPANLNDLVKEIAPRAVYLIYAKRGQGGEDLSATFYESAGEPKALWETDSGHVGGQEAQPVEYERRVIGFFDRFLLKGTELKRTRALRHEHALRGEQGVRRRVRVVVGTTVEHLDPAQSASWRACPP